MIKNNIGVNFRKLREERNITLDEACEGITSRARLSRWEKGTTNNGMPIEIVKKLLQRINATYDELIMDPHNIPLVTNKIKELYKVNDVKALKQLTKKLLSEYEKGNETIVPAAMAANFYLDLSGEDLFSEKNKSVLQEYCKHIHCWTTDEIIIFSNVQLLVNSQTLYELSRSLISNLYEKVEEINSISAIALVNTVFALIRDKKIEQAQDLIQSIKTLKLSTYDYYVIYDFEFMQALLDIITEQNYYKLNSLFSELHTSSKFDQLFSDFKFAFEQIKQIYHLGDK